jgi:hypothetical protein
VPTFGCKLAAQCLGEFNVKRVSAVLGGAATETSILPLQLHFCSTMYLKVNESQEIYKVSRVLSMHPILIIIRLVEVKGVQSGGHFRPVSHPLTRRAPQFHSTIILNHFKNYAHIKRRCFNRAQLTLHYSRVLNDLDCGVECNCSSWGRSSF